MTMDAPPDRRSILFLFALLATTPLAIGDRTAAQAPACPDEGMGLQVASNFEVGPDLLCGGSVINIRPPLKMSGGPSLTSCPAFINFEPAYISKKTKVGFQVTSSRPMTGYLVLYDCETSYLFFMFPWDKKCNVASQTPFGAFMSHDSEAPCQAGHPVKDLVGR